MTLLRAATCQVASTSDPDQTLVLVRDAIEAAARAGAALAVLPEATMARFGTRLADVAQPLDGPWAGEVRRLAHQAGLVVVVGMFTPAADGRVTNTLLVTGRDATGRDATGRVVEERYDKIHVYDAYGSRESDTVAPGSRPVVVDVAGVRVGLATCYDLRVPALFIHRARAGADVVVVPSSWGEGPGKPEQWDLLVRARALDCTCWLVACDQADPATVGLAATPGQPGGIGRSSVVTPLGQVRGRLDGAPGVLVVDLDTEEVRAARDLLPVLRHARPLPSV